MIIITILIVNNMHEFMNRNTLYLEIYFLNQIRDIESKFKSIKSKTKEY